GRFLLPESIAPEIVRRSARWERPRRKFNLVPYRRPRRRRAIPWDREDQSAKTTVRKLTVDPIFAAPSKQAT
ncbi:MAG: hypothetical protein AAF802_08880, partial [Planctomycetota bacterium]